MSGGLDHQMQCITDRAEMHAFIDALPDTGFAILVVHARDGREDDLRIVPFGEARRTEVLGLLEYARTMTTACWIRQK